MNELMYSLLNIGIKSLNCHCNFSRRQGETPYLSDGVGHMAIFLLVLKSSYTASLTSMLTVQQLQPTVTTIEELLKNGEFVGYGRGSYVKGLLVELGFDMSKIQPYDTPEDYHSALSRGSKDGGVAAVVDEIPYIKLFLAAHCNGYTMVGPIYKAAGFGYVSLTLFIGLTFAQ
jgi:hypothetical protein